jgi:hypothetical protein
MDTFLGAPVTSWAIGYFMLYAGFIYVVIRCHKAEKKLRKLGVK